MITRLGEHLLSLDADTVTGGSGGAEPENQNNEPTGAESGAEEKITLTQKELNERLQKEADRRVTEAMKKWEKKLEEEKEKQAEELRKKEMEKMSQAERAAAELKEKQEKIAKKEAELKRKELDIETSNLLVEKNLPKELVSLFADVLDAEKRNAAIELIEVTVKKSVEERIKQMERGTFSPETDISAYVRKRPQTIFDKIKEKRE